MPVKLPRNHRGDTIVEVMIVLVVLAVILGSGYGIAVRSLQDTQMTQERTYALKIAEGQLESLKNYIQSGNNNPFSKPDGFCFNPAGTFTWLGPGVPDNDMNVDAFVNYDNGTKDCKKNPNDPLNNCASGFCYYYGIRRMDLGNGSQYANSFTVSVRWYGVRGNRQQVQTVYRVYQK